MKLIEKYKQFLPINEKTPMISMGEGFTPLVKSNNLVDEIGCKELYFKLQNVLRMHIIEDQLQSCRDEFTKF